MKAKKLLSVALATVLSASLLVGCGNKGGGSSSGEAKDTIVYSMNTAPEGIFNPLISNINIDKYVTSVVYASLMTVNDKGEQEPYLATESKVSDDMKKITYTLNDKAVWHDGEKVTANDVAYTFKCMADPNYTGGYYGDIQAVKGAEAYHNGEAEDIEGIKVIDDKTIEIEFEKVYAPGVTNLGNVEIIPEHIWSKVDPGEWTKQTELLNNPVGCGPYKLTEYKTGSHVKFEAATDFFGGEVKTPNLVFKAINADTTQAEFKGGNVDIANVESLRQADIDALTSEGLKTVSYDNYMFTYMGFNLRKDSLKDVKVRQAIMYAIDRQSILDNIVEGRGTVVNAPLLPSSWAYPEESELEQYKYNAEKAKSLLKEAGWEDKDGDGVVENANGEKLELTIDCQNDHEVRQKTATAIQESLKAIGISVEIDTMEYSALMDKAVANHDFDLYMMGNTLSLDPDPKPMWDSSAISNEPGVIGYNIVAYNNPETDKLIEEGNATLDQNERKSIYGEFAKILNRDVPEAYLFCQNVERVYNPNLEGYKPSTFNEFYNVHNWVIK
ncbi:ABC transporter substrate-binding protein [Peptacetobacter sp.]|uniref:ABC transporter substrate-binding protein n=1 Tax=unclassified Peptacetobacter TaxID=2991974 RepID=UPI002E799379|nr:ABC transporter substrate-binding protein [Peptacetobacter sp.]MEE0451044.1 ABC transporter substrate-binding protein [Peptacetobacter sp.]